LKAVRISLPLLVILAVVASACGPGAPAPAPSPTATPSSTVAVNPATPSPTVPPSPTPTPKPLIWPLTGLPASDAAAVARRPLNVRYPNDPAARPQVGLAKADIVFEMIVEGGITRHAAIFHSQTPREVGPVRSYRLSDIYLTEMLQGALVSSGSTVEEIEQVSRAIADKKMVSVDAQRGFGLYYRVRGRPGPNDLFADLHKAREVLAGMQGAEPVEVPALAFLPKDHDPMAGGFATSTTASAVTIPFRQPPTFTWDAAANVYRRSQGGVQTVDPDGNVPVGAANVVVIWTDITVTNIVQDLFGSLGLDYRMGGGGKASIFRDGRRVDGTWKRDAPRDMFTFFDQAGAQILLAPGQSWVHFVYPDWVVTSEP
jgi:hypothetical protein